MFNEKDLITWSTRDKAKIGKKYYFSNYIKGLQSAIKKNRFATLKAINDNNVGCPFLMDDECLTYDYYSCILEVKDE